MKKFMDSEFLLSNNIAKDLYNNIASKIPIIDYHCHLSPKEVYENRRYKNLTDIWLSGDHYKWRAMRTNGVSEKYITGEGSDYEKYIEWVKTLENCIGNPLYHWAHLELKYYFGIDKPLDIDSANEIWEHCNSKIQCGQLDVRNIIGMSNIEVIGTTDDPVDLLEYHKRLAEEDLKFKVIPTFRPDNAFKIRRDGFGDYIKKIESVCKKEINSFNDLLKCLEERAEYFNKLGCKSSDHGLEKVMFSKYTIGEVDNILKKALDGEEITFEEESKFFTATMIHLGHIYNKYGWVMQLHIGPLRNNNERMLKIVGIDSGFDSINDNNFAEELSALLNSMDKNDELPKTVLYCLNPRDNEVLVTMAGNFQTNGVPGKIQFGSGWWFNDQKDGMVKQLTAVSQMGVLSQFIGMITDSRSFLSFTRHEYFRRILCNFIGEIVVNGEYPNNTKKLEEIVSNICYYNSKRYFNID